MCSQRYLVGPLWDTGSWTRWALSLIQQGSSYVNETLPINFSILLLMVVVGFSGSLTLLWRLFFLTFRQSLWPWASSEDSTRTDQSTEYRPLKMLATETGEMLGRTIFRTWPKSPKNPQQPLAHLYNFCLRADTQALVFPEEYFSSCWQDLKSIAYNLER